MHGYRVLDRRGPAIVQIGTRILESPKWRCPPFVASCPNELGLIDWLFWLLYLLSNARQWLLHLIVFSGIRYERAVETRITELRTHIVKQEVTVDTGYLAELWPVASSAARGLEQLSSPLQVSTFVVAGPLAGIRLRQAGDEVDQRAAFLLIEV